MSVGRGRNGGADLVDEARFVELYSLCQRPIWEYCSRRVAADAVDDAVADTFLTVWRRLGDVPDGEAALLWVYGVAYRVIGHQWRSTDRRRRLLDRLRSVRTQPAPAAGALVIDDDELRLITAALAVLGDTDVEVLRLVAWEHLSITAVATVLGIQLDAARQRLHRARRNLAREYARLQSSPDPTTAVPKGGARR